MLVCALWKKIQIRIDNIKIINHVFIILLYGAHIELTRATMLKMNLYFKVATTLFQRLNLSKRTVYNLIPSCLYSTKLIAAHLSVPAVPDSLEKSLMCRELSHS
jgi:hypothetical protein